MRQKTQYGNLYCVLK